MTTSSPLLFRPARLDDIAAMSEIRLAVTENVLSDPAKISLQMYRDHMETLGRAWVCEAGGKVVGFCYAAQQDASIWALFINQAFEGLGIGARLLDLACAWLLEIGKITVTLSTAANTRADRFYTAHGWKRGEPDQKLNVGFSKNLGPMSSIAMLDIDKGAPGRHGVFHTHSAG